MTLWMVKCEMNKVCVTSILRGFFFFFVVVLLYVIFWRNWQGQKKGEKRNDKFISVWACMSADMIDLSYVNDQ